VAYTSQQGSAPVYLVFRVDSLDGQTYEEMLPQLEQAVPEQPPATDPTNYDSSAQVADAVKGVDIEVNPVFGRWSAARQAVVPPKVPGAPVTTTVPLTAGS
jgi:hypothetical protein